MQALLPPTTRAYPDVPALMLLPVSTCRNSTVARILKENGATLSNGLAATFLCIAAAEGDFPTLKLLSECGV